MREEMRKNRNKRYRRRQVILVLLGFLAVVIIGKKLQSVPSVDDFVPGDRQKFYESLAPVARSVGRKYDLFPSVILAQAALESGYGESELTKQHNNFFGMKAVDGKGVPFPTVEVEGGRKIHTGGEFAAYPSVNASFKAYGKLLGKAPRYEGVRNAKTPEEAAYALYPAGYTTDPGYGDLVVHIIERDNLKQYDF